jgi:hypothetical protein
MEWTPHIFRELSSIVDAKFDLEYRDLPDRSAWSSYLDSCGIMSRRGNYPGVKFDGSPRIVIECPWSVRNSTPGVVSSKIHIGIPRDLAEKIVVLCVMP